MRATATQQAGMNVRSLEPGALYWDPVGGAMVLVLTAPESPGVLRCDRVAMVPGRPLPCSYNSVGRVADTYLRPGCRYRDVVSGLEVRCLRGGHGYLTFAQRFLLRAPEN